MELGLIAAIAAIGTAVSGRTADRSAEPRCRCRSCLYRGPVRWEALFEDLESQLDAAHAANRAVEVAERTRTERASVTLGDRFRAARGSRVSLRLRDGEAVSGDLVDLAQQWLLLADGPRQLLVPTAAVGWVGGLGMHATTGGGLVVRRLTMGHVLRALARDRVHVRVQAHGVELAGRLDAVGADHVDVVVVPEGGRAGSVWAVPFDALDVIRSG
ncbi:hypothetical protein GALL_454120 [mine drainage metagenome]|uniref:Uncharacterized protein n=1 Tax=mine drainage metagenome TaxID=410659 RepID=A0A1J5PP69_9ZZZZ